MAFIDDIKRSLGGGQRLSIGETGGDPIVVDASIRESHSVSGQISEHPVEKGIDIIDNYRVLPRQIEIEGIVSDSPLTTIAPTGTLINSVVGLIEGDKTPSQNAWTEFQRFFDEAVVLTITTSLNTYNNMVLTDLSITRDTNSANGLSFTASAKEVRFVETEIGEAILGLRPSTTVGQEKKSAGKKTNTSANEKQQSLAFKALLN